MKQSSPAFQFYPADFLIGVMGMSDEEVGVYIKMLATQWVKGGLPSSPKAIKSIIGCRKIPSDVVLEKFELGEDGKLRNRRLESERIKQTSFRESRVISGSAGGAKRAERIAEARFKATHEKHEWIELRDFFEGCCICGKTEGICKDHITPIYQGGSDGIENLQPLCVSCNSSKGPDCKDYRPQRAAELGKQMPSKWLARATEQPKQNAKQNGKQNVALHTSSSHFSVPPTPIDEFSDMPTETANDFDTLQRKIRNVHPHWKKPFSRKELDTLLANAKALMAVTDLEWTALGWFYGSEIPAEWGTFWRPDGRDRFMQDINDILIGSKRWVSECRRNGVSLPGITDQNARVEATGPCKSPPIETDVR